MSEWLDGIHKILADGPGTREQKTAAWRAAQDVETAEGPIGEAVRRMYTVWARKCGYMAAVPSHYSQLPESVMENRSTDNTERRENRRVWREKRIEHATGWIQSGGTDSDAMHFIASREEWREAMSRFGRAVHDAA